MGETGTLVKARRFILPNALTGVTSPVSLHPITAISHYDHSHHPSKPSPTLKIQIKTAATLSLPTLPSSTTSLQNPSFPSMVGTHPTNKLKKIPHGTSIDLTTEPSPVKTKVRRRIKMEKEAATASTVYAEEDPTIQDATLLKNLAGGQPSPGNSKGEEGSEKEEEEEEQSPTIIPEKPPSTTSKRKREKSTPSTAKTPAVSSHTQTPADEAEEKENSDEGSSSEQANSENEPSVEVVKEEPPAKRAQIQTRAFKRKKKMAVKANGKEP